LTVSRAVVNDSDFLGFQGFNSVLTQRATEVNVIGHHAERAGVALTGVLGVGRGRRDLGNASVVVDLQSGDGGAGVQVTDHAVDFGVDQLGSGSRALLGIGGVVFGQQFKLDGLAVDHQLGRIEFFNGHLGAVFVVFAQVGNATAGRTNVTDFDHLFGAGGFFFFATSGQSHGSGDDGQFDVQVHENPLMEG